jgi:enoyl-CoA hydratase/carnithine racemase
MARIVSEPTTTFTIEVDAPAAFFTINRPDAGNAMTWAMYDALVDACERVDASAGLRAFVIRANGATFCTGTDISQFTGFSTREDGVEYERRLEACVARLERVTVPTIAQVEGIAAGAGCVIALACDLRVCTPAAKFGVPIARTLGNGLSFENCARLVEHFGASRTSRLLLTGGFIDAGEAAASGAIAKLVEPAGIGTAVAELVSAIARNAPLTIRAAKAALSRLRVDRRTGHDDIEALVADCYASADFREGVSAFLAKRPPKFNGR